MKKMILLFSSLICSLVVKRKVLERRMGLNDMEIVPIGAIPFLNAPNESNILMNEKEIIEYNQKILDKTDKIYNLDKMKMITKEEIEAYINFYSIPSLSKYENGSEISDLDVEIILENRNMAEIEGKESLQKALVVRRCNLKSFPTSLHFYEDKNRKNFDYLQETELYVNTPLLVLHESKDLHWIFVMSPLYVGWISKECVVYVNEKDFDYFIDNQNFIIITASKVEVDGIVLDMSVKLPYVGMTKEGYRLVLPINDDGKLKRKEVIVASKDAHIGYLPYTKRNLILQAFKYENTSYQWGGMDKDVDCSSYIATLYRTFGFCFPRNTSIQKDSIGEFISLNLMSREEKKAILRNYEFGILYQPGHVMLYLGMRDENPFIIHASWSKGRVVLTNLNEDTFYLSKIDRIVLIP